MKAIIRQERVLKRAIQALSNHHSRAKAVPRWRAASNAKEWGAHPRISGKIIRWPEEEIGKISIEDHFSS